MKNNKILIQLLLICVMVTSTFTSCKKEFFDINEDPNNPASVGVNYLLPSAQAAIASGAGGTFNIYGGIWGQYWTQNPAASQYRSIEQYNITADEFDRPWSTMYSDGLADLRDMEARAAEDGLDNYVAIGKILEAYTFQVLTDNFGDIPFTEALDPNITSPKYDSQETVYNGIIQLAKDGIAMIDLEGQSPGEDDLFMYDPLLGHSDMEKWERFANTLLLRMYLRLAYVKPEVAQAGIQELQASGAEFLDGSESVELLYGTGGGNTNPLYATAVDLNIGTNIVASATAINKLIALNDPRIDVVYSPDETTGNHTGIVQGGFSSVAPGSPVSSPGPITGANSDANPFAPVILISGYESLFLQAEAAARGWLTTASAEELYTAGIEASFYYLGIADDSVITEYTAQTDVAFPAGGSQADQIKAIITQKWLAMTGLQGNEAWTEWRRTGYPDFFTVSLEALNGGVFPQRFIYPSLEQTRNANFPGQKPLTEKVWWDVN